MIKSFENNYENNFDSNNNYKFDYHAPVDGKDYINKMKEVSYKCLNLSFTGIENKILNMTLEQKLEAFKHSDCPPVVVLPGFMGSKMEFLMKDCSQFEKFHPNIMKSCGWKNCRDPKLKNFPIWINTELNVMEILGIVMEGAGEQNKKKKVNKISKDPYIPHLIKSIIVNDNVIEYEHQEECFGNLFRLYFTKNMSDSNNSTQYKPSNLKGAKIKVKLSNKINCGLDTVSNYLGDMFSTSRVYQGFSKLDEYLLKMGYSRGVSLFYHPYDFRLPLSHLMRRIHNTVKIAYKITKKKPIIISHSLGGLLAYKYSLQNPDLINRIVTIGTPFMGAFAAADNFIMKKNLINTEKSFSIFGYDIKLKANIDERSLRLLLSSFNNLHLFPKHILNDHIDQEILKISKVEENYLKDDYFINSDDDENKFLKYFYERFPKPHSNCFSVVNKNRNYNTKEKKNQDNEKIINSPICKINYRDLNTNPIIHKHGEEFKIGRNFSSEFKESYKEIWNEDIELINKNIHDEFRIETETYIDYIFDSQEKEVFAFTKPKTPFTIIYSHHIDTPVKITYEKNKKQKIENGSGDGTVGGFSQLYPGLRWLFQEFQEKENGQANKINPIHFVEYCAHHKKKTTKSYDPNTSQYISLSCDCIDQTNLNSREVCNHVSMLGDTKLIMFIGDVILKSKSKIEKIEKYENLYNTEFKPNMICSNLDF